MEITIKVSLIREKLKEKGLTYGLTGLYTRDILDRDYWKDREVGSPKKVISIMENTLEIRSMEKGLIFGRMEPSLKEDLDSIKC